MKIIILFIYISIAACLCSSCVGIGKQGRSDTLKYDLKIYDDQPNITHIEVHTPSKYNFNQLDSLTSMLRTRHWLSDHLVIDYRVTGDETIKIMGYAQAMYWTPDFAAKMARMRDLNGIAFQLEMNELYDSDSTNYYKSHPIK